MVLPTTNTSNALTYVFIDQQQLDREATKQKSETIYSIHTKPPRPGKNRGISE